MFWKCLKWNSGLCVCVLLHIPLPSEDYMYLTFIYNKGVSCTTELHKYLVEGISCK